VQVNPYLNFDGQCEAAFRFYAEVLGGTIEALFRFAETPASMCRPVSATGSCTPGWWWATRS
jgi:PhnB protein